MSPQDEEGVNLTETVEVVLKEMHVAFEDYRDRLEAATGGLSEEEYAQAVKTCCMVLRALGNAMRHP